MEDQEQATHSPEDLAKHIAGVAKGITNGAIKASKEIKLSPYGLALASNISYNLIGIMVFGTDEQKEMAFGSTEPTPDMIDAAIDKASVEEGGDLMAAAQLYVEQPDQTHNGSN